MPRLLQPDYRVLLGAAQPEIPPCAQAGLGEAIAGRGLLLSPHSRILLHAHSMQHTRIVFFAKVPSEDGSGRVQKKGVFICREAVDAELLLKQELSSTYPKAEYLRKDEELTGFLHEMIESQVTEAQQALAARGMWINVPQADPKV